MKFKIFVLLCFTAFTLSACLQNATALRAIEMTNHDLAEKGSAYRIKAREVKGGVIMTEELAGKTAATLADEQLTKDVFQTIIDAEKQLDPLAQPELVETRQVLVTPEKVSEIWVVTRREDKIPYVVDMRPSPQGGVDMNIRGWAPLPKM